MNVTSESLGIVGSIAGGIFAGATAWAAMRWEQVETRRRLHHGERLFRWLAENFMILAQSHNDHHPGGKKIDVSGLAKLLFESRNAKD
jgi:hypothetical protein